MSSIPISDRLLRNLASRQCSDSVLMRAYETGEAITKKATEGLGRAVGRHASRFISRVRRLPCTSPDRIKSRNRRRILSRGSSMPDTMRAAYTEGEAAVMAVIGGEVKRRGYCDLPIDAIAAKAGVSRTTVQNAIRQASASVDATGKKLSPHVSVEHRPQPGRKNLTNVIRIVSSAWMAWIRRSIGFKTLNTSKSKEVNTSLLGVVLPSQGGLGGNARADLAAELDAMLAVDRDRRRNRPDGPFDHQFQGIAAE